MFPHLQIGHNSVFQSTAYTYCKTQHYVPQRKKKKTNYIITVHVSNSIAQNVNYCHKSIVTLKRLSNSQGVW